MSLTPTKRAFVKWENSNLADDYLQLSTASGKVSAWIDSTGTPQGALATVVTTPFLGVPTGPCSPTQTAVDTTTGNFYSCVGGSWLKVGPGAAGTLSSPIVTPNPLAFDVDLHFKGPTPWADITRFGARAIPTNATPAIPGITASITSTQTTATISSASSFINGDGVVIYGAGTAHAMTTPTGLTVTPSLAMSGTGTRLIVNGITGATTYNYQIIARNRQGGMTAAGTVASTTTGAAGLGKQTVNITSISKSGLINTVVTATAHGLAVGAMVFVSSNNDADFSGWFKVNTVPDNTHFTYANGRDSANGSATSTAGGTVSWWNCNRLAWTKVTGAWIYYIYGRTGGSLTLLGVSWPDGSSAMQFDDTWDDFGSPMMDNFTAPYFVPTTPPGAATSNHLSTTIVTGAGTTTLTLANAAGTTVSGATILFDNAPAILAATTSMGAASFTPAGSFVINSYLTLPGSNALSLKGSWYLNDTVETGGGFHWYGDRIPGVAGAASFAFANYPGFFTARATPAVYIPPANSGLLTGLTFGGFQTNNALLLLMDTPNQIILDGINFECGGLMDIGMFWRADLLANSAFFMTIRDVLLSASQLGPVSATPVFGATYVGTLKIYNVSATGRAIHIGNSQNTLIEGGRYQGGGTPFLMVGGYISIPGDASDATIRRISLDTTSQPLISNLTGSVNAAGDNSKFYIEDSGTPTGAILNFSGSPVGSLLLVGSSGTGQNTAVTQILGGSITATGSGTGIRSSGTSSIGYAMSSPAAPTVILGGAGSCSSNCVASGTHNYQVVAIDVRGFESPLSAGTSVTTDGTKTVTVSWTLIPGQVLTRHWRDGASDTNPGVGTTGTSFIDSAGGAGAYSNSGLNVGGAAVSMSSFGLVSNLLTMSPVLFVNLGTPANGTFANCADCTTTNPCAGSGTGAFAKRFNGVWVCN